MSRPSFAPAVLAALALAAVGTGFTVSVQASGSTYGSRATPVVGAVQRALPAVVSIVAELGARRGSTGRQARSSNTCSNCRRHSRRYGSLSASRGSIA